MSSPAMGTASSQLEPSQTQDIDQEVENTQEPLPQLDGANMDDPAQRDDETHVKKPKSADATKAIKRFKKDRQSDGLVNEGIEFKDSQDATDNANQDATEAVFKRPSKKKSKKQQVAQDERKHDIGGTQATQSSVMLDETPQSTADTTNSDAPKRAKTKRKRHTGRPSGLNIMPAGMSDPATQEESVGPGADRSDNMGLSSQPKVVIQAESRKTSLPSPETTNVQTSQPIPQKAKASKGRSAMANGTTTGTDKAPKSPKRRRAESSGNMEELPTPRGVTQAQSPKSNREPPQPVNDDNADDGALRDDYAQVDATRQVEGWLSSQLADEDSAEPSSVRSPESVSRKKAAKTASTKRKAAPLEEDKATTKRRKRTSKHLENDSEDYAPEEEADNVVEDTPGSTGRHKNRRAGTDTEVLMDEPATQDVASPLVSKKGRMSSQKKEKPAKKKDTAVQDRSRNGASAGTPSKKEQQPKSVDSNDEEEEEEPSNKKFRPKDRRARKGPLSSSEKAMVDGLFQDTIKELGISEYDLCAMIKNWKTATDFKEAVEEALPDRPVAAIRKFCQRRYHNMERGPWSSEDDDALKKAYKASPDKWTEIGALVGRTASDCKDRWKNTVSIQDTMQVGPWSQEETESLKKAVDACVKELKKAKKENKDLSRADLESMLSWAEVAKKLGGTRSAKRCNEKWRKLKLEERTGRASISTQPLPTGVSSKKLRLIEKSYNECDIGDLYDMLMEIHTALRAEQHFDHESTLWAVVSMKNPGSRFKSAMRRKALYDACEVYKADVPKMPTITSQAKALADHLESEWGVEALAKKRAFGPKPKVSKIKSAERVDSDEDEEEVENEEERVAPETDTPPTSNDDDDVGDDNIEDDDEEESSEKQPGVEIPDSQPLPAAKSKRFGGDSPPSFKPINSKKRKEAPSSPQADSDVVEQLPSSTKRKKSSKNARAKMQA